MWLIALAHAAETFDGRTFYVGDPHVHTGVSGDGGSVELGDCTGDCGALADYFRTARANGLDWLVVSEHVNGTQAADEGEWHALLDLALAYDREDPGFVVVPGAEIWLTVGPGADLGHRTLMLFGDDREVAGVPMTALQPAGTDIEVADCAAVGAWMAGLQDAFGPALLVPHHPGMTEPMITDWSCHDPALAPVVEVYSQHGLSLDRHFDWDVPLRPAAEGTVEEAIDPAGFGLQMGFIAGTDSHDTRPGSVCTTDGERTRMPYGGGLTLVSLPEGRPFDRVALHDALHHRRTLASTGPVLPVTVTYRSDGVTLGGLGDPLRVPPGQPLEVTVRVPAGRDALVDAVTLIRPDGEVSLAPAGSGTWTVTLPAAALPAYVYVEVRVDGAGWWGSDCADGGEDAVEFVWSSPSWIGPGPRSPDEDEAEAVEPLPDADGEPGAVPEEADAAPPPPDDPMEPEARAEPEAPPEAAGCATAPGAGGAGGSVGGTVGGVVAALAGGLAALARRRQSTR